MGEIKNKLNISKITIKNLFLVILLMAVMAVISVAAKLIGSRAAGVNIAQAQSCWTPPAGTGSGNGEADTGDSPGDSCSAESDAASCDREDYE